MAVGSAVEATLAAHSAVEATLAHFQEVVDVHHHSVRGVKAGWFPEEVSEAPAREAVGVQWEQLLLHRRADLHPREVMVRLLSWGDHGHSSESVKRVRCTRK